MKAKKNNNFIYNSFGCLLIIYILFENIIHSQLFILVLIPFLAFLIVFKKINAYEFLILSMFVPQKYYQLLSVIIFLICSGYISKRKIDKSEVAFLLFITIVSIINCFCYKGIIIASLFQVIVYYCLFGLIYEIRKKIEFDLTIVIFEKMFIVQTISVILQYGFTGVTDDALKGTLISAHYLGIFLVVYLYIQIKYKNGKKIWKDKILKAVKIVVSILLLILSDAKHVGVIFLFAFFVFWVLNKLKVKYKLSICGVLLFIGLILCIWVLKTSFVSNKLHDSSFGVYIYDPQYNKKFTYLDRTFQQMASINGLVGFGVGQYGSQISLTMSKGLIHYWVPSEAAFKYAIKPFKLAFNGLMDEWYSNIGMPISSFVLGYPFVTFIAMIAELGLFGFVWFLYILDRKYYNCNKVFLFAFIMLGLFDLYLEIPCVFTTILIGTEFLGKKVNV